MKLREIILSAKQGLSHPWLRWGGLPLLTVATLGVVLGQSTTAPLVALADQPMYARGVRAKPTLSLALSVEFPTVGQAYSASTAYGTATEYIGYFDANSCYTYDDTNKRFERSAAATARACAGAGFSGNFMNWATTSAIDVLRYSLTGGDRITDTSTKTVLQRAVIPEGFYNSSNFSSKSISNALALGALPSVVLGSHTGNVYVANCLNRVFFGTEATGSCNSPGNNSNLGASLATSGPVSAPRPADFTLCASENGTCTFTGTMQVIYGSDTNSTGGTGAYATRVAASSIACTNGVFGDPVYGIAKRCYYRAVPAASGATANQTIDSYYQTRVSVCDSTSGTLTDPRPDLCARYPNGNYKPVGNLQRYSDRMRVAAFGYLRDDTLARYGGVLRAPMKYVGPQAYDSDFNLLSGANPTREWDEQTGVFYENPNASTEFAVSGVTNYLNRFGRTGATPGTYKTNDPVGELYYESLRYIQGLPPTPAATSDLTSGDARKDGFPVYDTWTDPHPAITGLGTTGDYSCVKNNILTIGDVNTHADKTIPGNTRTSSGDLARAANVAANEPNFVNWTRVVGAFEANRTSQTYSFLTYPTLTGARTLTTQAVQNPNTPNDLGNLDEAVLGCCNNNSYYMAGVAYWANTHDIRGATWTDQPTRQRPGMRARTFVVDVNEYGAQDNANTRRNNQFYLAAKYGGFDDRSDRGNPFFTRTRTGTDASGAPIYSDEVNNSNWQRGNAESDAKTYFLAGNPRALLDALDSIFEQIATESNSIAGGAITTQTLTASGGSVFQATFDASNWSGDILAYGLTLNNSTVSVSSTANVGFRAAERLRTRTAARTIVVGRTAPTATSAATSFDWDSIGDDHKAALQLPAGGTVGVTPSDSAASGAERLNYLRGTRTQEAPSGPYRRRGSSVLGDIVNSGVVFKGAPSRGIAGAAYDAFYNANENRTKALYVGANDGMLHAFNATTGDELFGYIPSFVVSKLSDLTAPTYTHRSYVDATPFVSEANLNASNETNTNWRTVLVSGAGGGGQGVFALDVTNPSSFTAASTLWEFTDANDVDMGNVVGRPQILKVRTSAPTATPVYKWYAVVASGVNNYASDGRASNSGNPVLFFLEIGKPVGTAWTQGTNYFKLVLPQASNAVAKGAVAFSANGGPADDIANLYVGDLQGNLWKFNFTALTSGNGTDVNVSSVLSGGGSLTASEPMFVAQSASGVLQPITMEPSLVYGVNRKIIVAFGTGKYLEPSDNIGPFGQQSVYAVLDSKTTRIDSRSRLRALTQDGVSREVTGEVFTWGEPTSSTDVNTRPGWYFDFEGGAATGERQISGFTVFGRKLLFGSLIPAASGCSSGSGYHYSVELLSGDGDATVSTVGIPSPPFIIKTPGETTYTNNTGGHRRTEPGARIAGGSGGPPTSIGPPVTDDAIIGRLSWRQIHNYQELKN